MIIAGIAFGFYVGVWVCFVGGIVQLINEIKSPEAVSALSIGWGIAKIVFAGFFGWLAGAFVVIPGIAMMKP